MNKILEMNTTFAADVLKGLSSEPKFLPSKYFYNEKGDELFQAIMKLDEYYLTRCEYEILTRKKHFIAHYFGEGRQPFNLIELGAGDGYKTKVLLRQFLEQQLNFNYIPVDISSGVLETLVANLNRDLTGLNILPYQGDYFHALKQLNLREDTRKVVLFLGSNIGNFKEPEALAFLKGIAANLSADDLLFIGFDLKKDPHVILKAYNDASGITREFNLNLLRRINDELGGNFNINKFTHYPLYDPGTGQARSYLISREEQEVHIESIGKSFSFRKWEPVFVEVSQKYSIEDIERLARLSGFKVVEHFFDEKHYFVDTLLKVGVSF